MGSSATLPYSGGCFVGARPQNSCGLYNSCHDLGSLYHAFSWDVRVMGPANSAPYFTLVAVLAATKQLYEWSSPSVSLSVTPFLTMFLSLYQDFFKQVMSRSEVKITGVKNQFGRFQIITPV